jgi:hypothetical protein
MSKEGAATGPQDRAGGALRADPCPVHARAVTPAVTGDGDDDDPAHDHCVLHAFAALARLPGP